MKTRSDSDLSVAAVFGQRVRSARLAKSWTQAELADVAAVGIARIPVIEAGRVNPRLDTAAALARALGVPLRDLING
jgi:transcriptional regulator with XRE-family HTH domain